MRAICSERSWLLPAHDRALENYYGKTFEIDLNSAATSWNLATADYWLGDRLSANVRQLIRRELERRTFTPLESYAQRASRGCSGPPRRTTGTPSAWPASRGRP